MTDINKKDSNEVESPCVRNCCLNEDDVCLGCFRHVDEICEWGVATNFRRESILDDAKKRKAEYAAKWPPL